MCDVVIFSSVIFLLLSSFLIFIRISICLLSVFNFVKYFVDKVMVNFGVGWICFVVNDSMLDMLFIIILMICCFRFSMIIIVLLLYLMLFL